MSEAKHIAEHAAMQSFLNCYIRETGTGEWLDAEAVRTGMPGHLTAGSLLVCRLPEQGIIVYVLVKYRSATGRHLFDFPVYYRNGDTSPYIEADYLTLTALLVKELTLSGSRKGVGADAGRACPDELVLRVIQSCRSVESFIQARAQDAQMLYGWDTDFIQAEQSLLFGHLQHPTPKSQQGIPRGKQAEYSPELGGEFALHYFRAHASLVLEDSASALSASELVKEELSHDPAVPQEFIERYCRPDGYSLMPVHPLQAEWLKEQPHTQNWLRQGLLEDLGPQGRRYKATSSLRTVYHPESSLMFKLSVQVKVTNSLRINKRKELESGVEVTRLLKTGVGEVHRRFPGFQFICDPAYLTLRPEQGDEESGFEVILRENPFQGTAARNATLVAALVQDALPGHHTRLAGIIHRLSEQEGRSVQEVSLDWFRQYLQISLRPMVWLYLTYGIALEAHQQNSVVQLKDGYPDQFFFRDNQGYYYCRSVQELLERELPGIGVKSRNLYNDDVADERLRYYLIYNHMFGLINGFGASGLIEEQVLLSELRRELEAFLPMDRKPSRFLYSVLNHATLACKANLLTRFYDVDELEGMDETPAVYVEIDNPLVTQAQELETHGPGSQLEGSLVS